MKKLVISAVVALAASAAIAVGVASGSGGGGTLVDSGFACTILDGNGNAFITDQLGGLVLAGVQGAFCAARATVRPRRA